MMNFRPRSGLRFAEKTVLADWTSLDSKLNTPARLSVHKLYFALLPNMQFKEELYKQFIASYPSFASTDDAAKCVQIVFSMFL